MHLQSIHRLVGIPFVLVLAFASCCFAAENWPEWRGAGGQGISSAKGLPLSWSETENVAWKTEIPGLGWSTPIIDNGVVWLTTAIDRPATEAQIAERKKATNNSQPLTFSTFVSMRAVSVDLESGKVLSDIEMMTEDDPQFIHHLNSYATPTPIFEDGKLYCHYGTFGIACLDTKTGKVLWTNRDLRIKHENGPGSSPILWRDRLIIHCDGIDQQYIVAIDKATGSIKWKTPRSGKLNSNPQLRKSYATALVVDVDGKPQIVSPAADWVYGYDPQTGEELWRLNYGELGFSNAPRPVAGHGLVYICTGYMKSKLLAVRPVGAGAEPSIEWEFSKQVPAVSSPILVGNELYFASDRGVATCLDAKTGDTLWTQRLGKKFWASPIYADGRIYFLDSSGATTIIEPGRKFKRLSVNKLDGTLFAAPAAVDGALILRTDKALYRLN